MNRFQTVCGAIVSAGLISIGSALAGEDLKILPLGNSLTYGYSDGTLDDKDRVGYRYALYNLLNAGGYAFDFVGHQSTGYGVFDDHQHGGTLGFRDNQLGDLMLHGYYYDKYWTKYTVFPSAYLNHVDADIILLHIGTNDISYGNEDFNYTTGMKKILDAVDNYESSAGKDVLVLVAKIINKKNANGNCEGEFWQVDYLNQVFTQEITDRVGSTGDKVVMVDMQCGASIDYYEEMIDDLHPVETGYEKMAAKWYEAIDGLNLAPVLTDIPDQTVPETGQFTAVNLDQYVMDDFTPDAEIQWTVSPAPQHYDVIINDRVAVIVPKDAEWTGSEEISFTAADGGRYIEKLKKTAGVTAAFTVTEVNEVPVILSQTTAFTPDEDTDFELLLSDLEIEDDNPPEDWTLIINAGENYQVEGNTIIPAANYDGGLEIEVTVKDPVLESDPFTVIATINPRNDPPVITGNTPLEVDEDHSFTIQIEQLVIEDPDNVLSEHTMYVSAGSNYSLNGTDITPAENYNGMLSVNVRVRDLQDQSNLYALPVEILPVNDPPEISSVPETEGSDNEEYNYTLKATDTDGDNLVYRAFSIPAWLAMDSVNGILKGQPEKENAGSHYIELGADDGTECTKQVFVLEIDRTNSAPSIVSAPETSVHVNESYSYSLLAEDADEDAVKFFKVKIPDFLLFLSETKKIIGTPAPENQGMHEVIIGATDGIDTAYQTYTLGVEGINPVETFTSAEGRVEVFPNPAETEINIRIINTPDVYAAKLMNTEGQIIHPGNNLNIHGQDLITIEVSDIPAGIYTLLLYAREQVLTRKLIIY